MENAEQIALATQKKKRARSMSQQYEDNIFYLKTTWELENTTWIQRILSQRSNVTNKWMLQKGEEL